MLPFIISDVIITETTHLCQMNSSMLTLSTGPFRIWEYLFSLLPCFIEIPIFNANSVDPGKTPHFVASDLRLHCLPMSLLWDARV